ncbi:hypothetical protein CBA19CS22_02170 [Caballeronia novacaledonica]|uniref:Uncharacterized protein n=1 Tax=Caballeronia novacaledonica TaxID=1544861 RepID=A0ACB5QK23_9BURK|nr:hypothetical protein CBA19CS22_02170 [Caballeronia novacaledonica]
MRLDMTGVEIDHLSIYRSRFREAQIQLQRTAEVIEQDALIDVRAPLRCDFECGSRAFRGAGECAQVRLNHAERIEEDRIRRTLDCFQNPALRVFCIVKRKRGDTTQMEHIRVIRFEAQTSFTPKHSALPLTSVIAFGRLLIHRLKIILHP